jgi:hypothetical protein
MSGRGIKEALEDSDVSRDTIEAALKYGLRTGAIVVKSGPRNARLYRRSSVSGSVRECPADSASECPGAYISPDTRTLVPLEESNSNGRTLDRRTLEHF